MKKLDKKVILALIIIVLFSISLIMFFNDMMDFFVIIISCTFVLTVYLCLDIFKKEKNKNDTYERDLKKLLKTYDSILVYADNYDITEDSVIYVKNIDELARFCEEMKKTIIFVQEDEACSFILKNDEDLLVYLMKKDKNSKSKIENKIKKMKENVIDLRDENILDDLEKTTVIRFKDNKIYKVSPIRSQK